MKEPQQRFVAYRRAVNNHQQNALGGSLYALLSYIDQFTTLALLILSKRL